MRNAWTIAKREFAHYFVSPIAYVVALMFLLILGLLFMYRIAMMAQQGAFGGGGSISMDSTFGTLSFLALFFIPVLTMRLLSDEQNKGTLELLLTSPLQEWELVLGKWLGAWFFGLCLIGTTAIYALILFAYGKPDPGPVYAGYLGLALVFGALLAIGLFASSLTGNLIASVIIGLGFTISIYIIGIISDIVEQVAAAIPSNITSAISTFFKYLNFADHFQSSFVRGVINTTDIVYFLSVIVIALFLTTRVVQSRRWR